MINIPTEITRHLALTLGSTMSTFLIAIIGAPHFIKLLKRFQFGQQIRTKTVDGKDATLYQELHKKKSGTPSMGGILIWGSVLLAALLSLLVVQFNGFADNSLISREETYLPLFTLTSFALLGLVDDIFNIKKIGGHKGLKALTKMAWLIILSLLGGLWFYYKLGYSSVNLGIFGEFTINAWYIPLFMLVIISSANAVNITDGLDGLAGGLIIIAFVVLGIVSYTQGLVILAALCGAIAGATLGFLWFNVPPAAFFMGDTGSLALGATIGVIGMLMDNLLLIPFITFIFIIETLSVIIQLTSKKFRGKKVFKIAPVHHHFEYIGWPEFRVTMRFWIIGGLTASIGLILFLAGIV